MEATTGHGLKYEPKFGRVLVKREIKEKSAGGIIIPDAKRHASCEGVIVALGETAGFTDSYFKDEDGTWQLHTVQTMKVGQRVLFGRHSGAWLDSSTKDGKENDDGTLFICQDQDILAIIKETL